MKAVLISIHPRHCENIASGKKTVEVRKSMPKLEAPFKCYIYQTKGMTDNEKYGFKTWARRGRVIGEFVCNEIWKINVDLRTARRTLKDACLTAKELDAYRGYGDAYGWHISDLKIYDKPRELSEFRKPCDRFLDCFLCRRYKRDEFGGCDSKIRRPPQSWMYVEEI